jgi:hypothetical protein
MFYPLLADRILCILCSSASSSLGASALVAASRSTGSPRQPRSAAVVCVLHVHSCTCNYSVQPRPLRRAACTTVTRSPAARRSAYPMPTQPPAITAVQFVDSPGSCTHATSPAAPCEHPPISARPSTRPPPPPPTRRPAVRPCCCQATVCSAHHNISAIAGLNLRSWTYFMSLSSVLAAGFGFVDHGWIGGTEQRDQDPGACWLPVVGQACKLAMLLQRPRPAESKHPGQIKSGGPS